MNPILKLVKNPTQAHGDLYGDVTDYVSVHINGVPAKDIPEIQSAVPRAHMVARNRSEDCGIWVSINPVTKIPIPIVIPEEFGTPERMGGYVQVYSTSEGWL